MSPLWLYLLWVALCGSPESCERCRRMLEELLEREGLSVKAVAPAPAAAPEPEASDATEKAGVRKVRFVGLEIN